MIQVSVRKQMVLTDGSMAIGVIFFGIGILLDGGIDWNSNWILGDSVLSSIMTILGMIFVALFMFFKFRRNKIEIFDELAKKNLSKAEAQSYWCSFTFIIFIGIFGYTVKIPGGYIIIGAGILELLRIAMFILYDKFGDE